MSKLDEILKLSRDNDGIYYTARDKTDYHDEQKAQVKALILELIDETSNEPPDHEMKEGKFMKATSEKRLLS